MQYGRCRGPPALLPLALPLVSAGGGVDALAVLLSVLPAGAFSLASTALPSVDLSLFGPESGHNYL